MAHGSEKYIINKNCVKNECTRYEFIKKLDASVLRKSAALESDLMEVARFTIHHKDKFTICELTYDKAKYFGLAVMHEGDDWNEYIAVSLAFRRAYAEADEAHML